MGEPRLWKLFYPSYTRFVEYIFCICLDCGAQFLILILIGNLNSKVSEQTIVPWSSIISRVPCFTWLRGRYEAAIIALNKNKETLEILQKKLGSLFLKSSTELQKFITVPDELEVDSEENILKEENNHLLENSPIDLQNLSFGSELIEIDSSNHKDCEVFPLLTAGLGLQAHITLDSRIF
ncbi:hypothetical protein HHI36_005063 [Cryptolaemus montrouzieri]|uniref:Uncharacterized protein n=1 Tax=Cryptolaemus montrouzieri TaxID=559131 RepID=A0ABD2NTF8_9CUCU